jgi:hypothetical protein
MVQASSVEQKPTEKRLPKPKIRLLMMDLTSSHGASSVKSKSTLGLLNRVNTHRLP